MIMPSTMRAMQIDAYGGPDVVVVREVPVPRPAPGEVLVRIGYSGINFMDVYTRLGRYAGTGAARGHYTSGLPLTLGIEGAGRVAAVGDGVDDWRVGDRVAYALARGSYAEYAAVPARQLARVPDRVSFATAAAAIFHGLTADYLAHDIGAVGPGRSCLVHSGSGGIGQLLVQMGVAAGARVVATASSEAKRAVAARRGAERTAGYDGDDFVEACEAITDGRGVDVAFDSIGKPVLDGNLRAIRTKGLFVHYGANGGGIGPLDVMRLADSGSLYFTRPRLADYVADAATVAERASRLFDGLATGTLVVEIDAVHDFGDVAAAHRALEARASIGKSVLAIDPSLD